MYDHNKHQREYMAKRYIERVPKVVIPAAGSNGSVKPAWRRGAKA